MEQLWAKGKFQKENRSQIQTFPGVTQCGRELVQEAVPSSAALALSRLTMVCVSVYRQRVVEHHKDSKS